MANTARGRVVIVQERFFRLVTDDGRGLLLTLGTSADGDPIDLAEYRDRGAEVEVEYEGEPGTDTGKARRVRPV